MTAMTRESLGRLANRCLIPLGLRVIRNSTWTGLTQSVIDYKQEFDRRQHEFSFLSTQYSEAIAEVHGYLSELVFPKLPAREGRLKLMTQLMGTQPSEAMYLLWYLHQTLDLEGDVCEFGVAMGQTSALLANELFESDKTLWLFDSFQGLPAPSNQDQLIDDIFDLGSMGRYQGVMASSINEVQGRLQQIGFPRQRTQIVPGWLENTIRQNKLPAQVCFAYVDLDLYQPVLTALTFLRTRMPAGGVIVVDDYGFFSAGCQAAVDEFMVSASAEFEFITPPRIAGHFVILRRVEARK
jgi:O-methyltransferase